MHVICIVKQPFQTRDVQRYGIDRMHARGISITVLDVGPLVLPGLDYNRSHYGDFDDVEIRVLTTFAALGDFLNATDDIALAVFGVGNRFLTARTVRVLRALKRADISFMVMLTGAVPGITSDGLARRLLERSEIGLVGLRGINLTNSIVNRIPLGLLNISPAAAAVYGGRQSVVPSALVNADTKPIHAHSWDYDIYLRHLHSASKETDTAVFLDQFLPFHEDAWEYKAQKAAARLQEPYYMKLRSIFDRIERTFGLRVVVATHPRSQDEKLPGIFGDRELIKGETASLIRDCRLVLAHHSTAIGFAVMYRKPVMILVNEKMYRLTSLQKRWFDMMAEALGRPLQFFDDPDRVDLESDVSVDNDRYDTYLADYFKTPGTPDEPLWDIILTELSASGILH